MSFALTGTIGTVVQSTSGGAISGLAYGQSPTANNLLVCWWTGQGATTLPSTPATWSVGRTATGTSTAAAIYYKVAAGADAVPAFGAITSSLQTVRLAEFSGNLTVSPADQAGSNAGTTSGLVATNTTTDVGAGDLVAYAASEFYSTAATKTNSVALNNGATTNPATDNNNATSTVNHYNLGYGITSSASGADTATLTFTITKITGAVIALASFKPIPATGPAAQVALSPPPLGTPVPTSGYTLHARALITPSAQATLRANLWEGATDRSGVLETGALTTGFAEYTLAISDANAAAIVDYTNLSITFWGYSASGATPTVEVADVWLSVPQGVTTSLPVGTLVRQAVKRAAFY